MKGSIGIIYIVIFFNGFYCIFQDKPYNKDDDIIKATSFEVITTLRDVLKTSSLWRDHVQTYTQVCPFIIFFLVFRGSLFCCMLVSFIVNFFLFFTLGRLCHL